jgi:hypothetical protein
MFLKERTGMSSETDEISEEGNLQLRHMRKEYKNLTINVTPQIKKHKRKFYCTKELQITKNSKLFYQY